MERLTGIVRPYDWGDLHAIADLLGHPPSGRPEAEYWLGAHPSGPAVLETSRRPLDAAIAEDPTALLGPAVAERFGRLPFLVKILAARQALSIQAHPSLVQAEAGFAREEAAGLDRDAPERTYRDPNHKPELICALTPFEARCGFRDPAATLQVIEAFGPAMAIVRDRVLASSPAETALWLLALPADEAAPLARAVVGAAIEGVDRCQTETSRLEMASTIEIGRAFPDDVGVVVALLLNHVLLRPGQALFLGAGNVHAYLSGVGVEVMASSDNVIRGGLTAKHIDLDELAEVVDRRSGPIAVQSAVGGVHTFDVPVPDFAVTRIDTTAGPVGPIAVDPVGPEIVLVTAGSVTAEAGSASLELGPGQAAYLAPTSTPARLLADRDRRTVAWRVTLGH